MVVTRVGIDVPSQTDSVFNLVAGGFPYTVTESVSFLCFTISATVMSWVSFGFGIRLLRIFFVSVSLFDLRLSARMVFFGEKTVIR